MEDPGDGEHSSDKWAQVVDRRGDDEIGAESGQRGQRLVCAQIDTDSTEEFGRCREVMPS
ncbi:hypothetical protein ACIHCQ_34620 [Streptomyces sp. NPDC052236]|uniref:hypothetical protein n=1 Tax=Streptomyces sp. NPDC052236 TaxID=3365686 RepID=UPI0037D29F57